MLLGPKSILGLGSPAALRAVATTPNKGGGVSPFAFTYQGQPFTYAGIAFTYGAPA